MRTIHDGEAGSRHVAGTDAGFESRALIARRCDELERVIAVGRISFCTLAPPAQVVGVSSEFKVQFGWAPDAQLQWSDVVARVHSSDRAMLSDAVIAAFEKSRDFDLNVRVPESPNSDRWLSLRGRIAFVANATRELVIVARDVTIEKHLQGEQSQRLQRERELREAAEELNRSKDEFLSLLSHELRSPLNSILGWSRILSVKRPDDAELAAVTSRIERSARAQLKMINDLLDLGRISTRKFTIEPRPVKLKGIIAAAVESFRPAAGSKRIELSTEMTESPNEVYGDPDRLRQIVGNLLSNAIKFTDEEGRIAVRLRRIGDQLELSVTDTGQGIARELLPHVFDRFRQADNSTTRHARGLGLGLTLSREIAAIHGGSISASSDGPGYGATFTVRLPALRDPNADCEADHDGAHLRTRSALAGLSILVVDDEPDARAVVAETLRLEGAHVTVTDSACSALEKLRAEGARFHVVVTDIGMPVEDGYSLVRKVREMNLGGRVLAIALTGYASQRDRQAAFEAGFDVHVAKPVDFDDFVPMIRRMAPQSAENAPLS